MVLRNIVGQEFQGDEPTKFRVLGLVDHTHSAPAQLFDDAVVRDGMPDHWAAMLGLETGQVNEAL